MEGNIIIVDSKLTSLEPPHTPIGMESVTEVSPSVLKRGREANDIEMSSTIKKKSKSKRDGDEEIKIGVPKIPAYHPDKPISLEDMKAAVYEGNDSFTLDWLLQKACVKWGNLPYIEFSKMNQFIHNGMRKNHFGIRWVKNYIWHLVSHFGPDSPLQLYDKATGSIVQADRNEIYPSSFIVTQKGRDLYFAHHPNERAAIKDNPNDLFKFGPVYPPFDHTVEAVTRSNSTIGLHSMPFRVTCPPGITLEQYTWMLIQQNQLLLRDKEELIKQLEKYKKSLGDLPNVDDITYSTLPESASQSHESEVTHDHDHHGTIPLVHHVGSHDHDIHLPPVKNVVHE